MKPPQQEQKHLCVISTASSTIPKHSPVAAAMKIINSSPANSSTAPQKLSPSFCQRCVFAVPPAALCISPVQMHTQGQAGKAVFRQHRGYRPWCSDTGRAESFCQTETINTVMLVPTLEHMYLPESGSERLNAPCPPKTTAHCVQDKCLLSTSSLLVRAGC